MSSKALVVFGAGVVDPLGVDADGFFEIFPAIIVGSAFVFGHDISSLWGFSFHCMTPKGFGANKPAPCGTAAQSGAASFQKQAPLGTDYSLVNLAKLAKSFFVPTLSKAISNSVSFAMGVAERIKPFPKVLWDTVSPDL